MSERYRKHVAGFGSTLLGALLCLSGCAPGAYGPNAVLSQPTKSAGSTAQSGPTAKAPAQATDGAGDTAQGAGPTLSYALAAERLALHEPVVLNFTARNDTGRPLSLDLGADRKANFLFTVRGPDGKTLQLPRLRRGGISAPGQIGLEPGQVYAQKLLLNEWFEFAEPGAYEISARLAPQEPGGPASTGESQEFSGRLEIGPLDKGRLSRTCDSLLQQITGAASYAEAAEAALALSHVKDPLAIPFLEKAVSSGRMVDPIAISGLERIDGPEGERALAAMSEASQDEDVKELAEAAFERLKSRRQR